MNTDFFKNLTNKELEKIVNEGGIKMKNMMQKMFTYSANVNGSLPYLHSQQKKREDLMLVKGMCSMWFTVTATDNHWSNLHRHL